MHTFIMHWNQFILTDISCTLFHSCYQSTYIYTISSHILMYFKQFSLMCKDDIRFSNNSCHLSGLYKQQRKSLYLGTDTTKTTFGFRIITTPFWAIQTTMAINVITLFKLSFLLRHHVSSCCVLYPSLATSSSRISCTISFSALQSSFSFSDLGPRACKCNSKQYTFFPSLNTWHNHCVEYTLNIILLTAFTNTSTL
jgi:hypothetical protein